MAFDIAGALQEGYSYADIANHLAQKNNFDIAGARNEGYSDEQIVQHLTASRTAGIGEAIKGGTKRLVESIRTGIEAPFIGGEEAATRGIARQEAITERPAASLDEIKRIYKAEGLLPAAKEAISQLPAGIAEQAPFIGTMIGGARLGAMVGGVPGALAGAAISPFLSAAGSNIERQAQEDIKSGRPIDINRTRAYMAAIPQAALDVGAMEFGLGKALGISKMGTEASQKLAEETLKKAITVGIGKTALAEVPTEVTQQMLERYQAGLPLTDQDAVKEYKDTMYQAVLLSPLGGIARIAERGEAQQKQAALANLALDQQRAYGAAIAAEEQAKLKNDIEEIKRQKAIQDAILPPETYKLLPAPPKEIIATSTEALGTQQQIEDYLKTVPEDQQVAERARLMGMAPQPIASIISDKTLADLGIGKSAIIRQKKLLQDLDLTNPEEAQKAVEILSAYKDATTNKNTKANVEQYITNIPNIIEEAKNERLVAEGSRDNIQVSGQPISGAVSTTTQGELGLGASDVTGIVERPDGRTEAQPAALAPETTEVMKSAEELAPTTEEKAPTQAMPLTREAEDLITTVDEGGVPGFMTNNLRRIAKENGVEVTPADTPNTVIEKLRSKQEPKYAKEEVTTTSETPETILTALKERFGNNINKAVERGDVKLITSAQIPAGIASDAVAYFDKGVAHLITDRLSKEEAPRKILHEVGAHYGLEGMVGKNLYRDILRTVNRLKATDKDVRAAHEHVNNRYKELEQGSHPHLEEVLARLGESAPNHNLWRRIVAAVKDFLFRKGLWNTNRMDVRDIHDLINRSTARSLAGKIKPAKTTEVKYAKEEQISPEFEGTRIFAAPQENLERSFKEHVTDLKNFKYQEGTAEDLFLKGRIKAAYSGAGVADALIKKFNGAVRDALGNVRADILMSIGLQSNILGAESAKTGYVDFDSSNVAYVAQDQNNLANINQEIANLAQQIGSENAKHVTQAYLVGLRYQYELEQNQKLEDEAKDAESKGKKETAKRLRAEKIYVSEEQQAAIPEALSYGEKYPEVKRVADMYKVFNDNDTNMLEKAGIYSKDQAERYRNTKGYVPLFRLMDEMERANPGARQYFRGFADVGREYAFEGSDRQVLDVFDNMLTRHMWAVNAAVRNKANQQVAKQLAIRNERDKVELHENIIPEKADRMAPVFINGRRMFVEYTDPNFAIAIHGIEPALGPILGMFGKASRALRIGVTALPPFQVYQVFNDATRAAMLSGVKSPFKLMARVMTSFGTILKDQTNDPISIEMRRLGISGGYGHTAKEISDKMRRDLNLKSNTLMKQALDRAEKFAAASDMAQRRAIYIQTLLETGGTQNPNGTITGGNKVLAAHRAMDIINWQKHGTSGMLRILSQIVPFMNAYIQGMDVLIGAMRGQAISGTDKKVAKALFKQTALKIAALSMLYSMLIADDEEYQKLDDRTKIRSFIIPGAGVKIPVSAEVALLTKAIPELTYQYITREGTASPMDATKLGNELFVALLDGLLGPNLLPQVARPTLEAVTNYNFLTGSPIVGRGLENLRTSDQFTESTSELAKLLGKTGIISPLKADHLMKGYGGTAVAGVLYGTDAVANMFYEEKLPTTPLHKVPSIGAFFYNPNGKDQLNDFYDLKDRTDEVTATFNRLVKFGHPGEAREYAQENKELLAVKGQVNAITNNLKALRELRNSVIRSNLSSGEKRTRLDEIDLRINAMVKNIGAIRVKAGL